MSDRSIHYQLWRDQRLSKITGEVGQAEIEKLNHSEHGLFLLMDRDQCLEFELIYRLIIDSQNRDLDPSVDLSLEDALRLVLVDLHAAWVCQLLQTL